MQLFEDSGELEKALEHELIQRNVEAELARETVREAVQYFEEDDTEDDISENENVAFQYATPNGKWVIRNEHVDLLAAVLVGGGVAGILTSLFGPLDAVVPGGQAAILLSIGAARAILKVRKNVHHLTTEQSLLFIALREAQRELNEPVSLSQLTVALNNLSKHAGYARVDWDEELVQDTLESLQNLVNSAGNTESIVAQDGRGDWRLVGV